MQVATSHNYPHQVNSSQRLLGQSILLMSIINSCVLLIKEFDNIISKSKSCQEDRESKLIILHNIYNARIQSYKSSNLLNIHALM